MMKKSIFKLFSFVLSLALVSSFTVMFTACNNEKPEEDKKDPTPPPAHTHTYSDEWTYDETDHWHVATCEHTTEIKDKAAHAFDGDKCTVCDFEREPEVVKCTCETPCAVCPECGGCIDTDCTAEDCIKCGDGLTSHEFEAEECEMKNGYINFNLSDFIEGDEPPCTYVQGCMGNQGGQLIFRITSNKACTATLRVRNAKNSIKSIFTEYVNVIVNDGEPLERNAQVNEPSEGQNRKRDFDWTNLGCIDLIEGENTIVIEFWAEDGELGYNMDKIDVMTDADVELTWEPTDNTWRTPVQG